MNLISTHGLFYNPALGKVPGKPIEFNTLAIGHGVSIGHNAIILYPTAQIGDGAIIAPGSVVYSNVHPTPSFQASPAQVTGYRFDKETIAGLLAHAGGRNHRWS
jgi:acetyltransferase-like isoleucine patch superfamily enzyme